MFLAVRSHLTILARAKCVGGGDFLFGALSEAPNCVVTPPDNKHKHGRCQHIGTWDTDFLVQQWFHASLCHTRLWSSMKWTTRLVNTFIKYSTVDFQQFVSLRDLDTTLASVVSITWFVYSSSRCGTNNPMKLLLFGEWTLICIRCFELRFVKTK